MRPAILIAILAAVLGLEVWQAAVTPTWAIDEPLWFRKAQATSAHTADPDDRFYAIDVPGLNRWIYWPMFRITGLYKVPPGEPECWSLRDGRIYFEESFTNPRWPVNVSQEAFQTWIHRRGRYAPRSSIMALRLVNIAVYGVMLAALWYAARAALKSPWLAVLAVCPVALVPAFNVNVAFVVWSGDIFALAMLAVALAVWMRYHLKGQTASRSAILVISILCGLATASKLNGVLVLFAYLTYLAICSNGLSRLTNPLVAGLIAFATFLAVDPVVFLYPDKAPWQVLSLMVTRRMQVAADWTRREGPLGWSQILSLAIFWWPLVPVAVWAFWRQRRARWFLPLALWCAFNLVGTLAGVLEVNRADDEYMAQAYMALFFPVAVAIIALGTQNPEAEADRRLSQSPPAQ